jgi:hypothetical protein
VYSGFKTDFVAQYEAFRRRDPALDGVVFVVVKTTGAYCRVCPLALYAWTVQSGTGLLGWSRQELAKCESVRGPDADRHAKVLTIIRLEGSKFGA